MNYNYGMNDSNAMDVSTTAPSSAMGYFNQPSSQQQQQQQQQNFNSNNFWRKPQSQQNNQQPYTPLTTAGSYSGMQSAGAGKDNQGVAQGGEVDKLKMQLKIKESQIDSLESEIQRLNESLAITAGTLNTSGTNNIPKKVPGSLNEVFVELSLKHGKALEELEGTKMRLESLVTAITLNPSNSVTNNGRYDELEISHKILIKLENLKKENEELMKQLSFGKVKQMEMEMNLLKRENDTQREIAEKLKRDNEELALKLQEK